MARALTQPLDEHLHALLEERAAQLGPDGFNDTCIAIVELGEGIDKVAAEIGYPVTDEGEPTFEWVLLHPGGLIEVAFSFGDMTHVVIAQDEDRADAALIALFRGHAIEAPATEATRKAG